MGSNAYILAGALNGNSEVKLTRKNLLFNYLHLDNSSVNYFKENYSDETVNHTELEYCRETVVYDLINNFTASLWPESRSSYFEILAIGLAHNQVAEYLLKDSDAAKILSSVLSKIFGIKLQIKGREYDLNNDKWPYPLPLRLDLTDRIIMNNKYVSISILKILDYDEEFETSAVKISAILSILREYKICKNIVDKNLKTAKEVAEEIFHTANLRLHRKDKSFLGFPNWANGNEVDEFFECETFGKCMEDLLDYLQSEMNDEGTDYASVFSLGVFLMKMDGQFPAGYWNGPSTVGEFLIHNRDYDVVFLDSVLDTKYSEILNNISEVEGGEW